MKLIHSLILGKTEGKRRRNRQRMRRLRCISDSVDKNLSKLQEILKDRDAWCATVHGVTQSWTQLSDWTATIIISFNIYLISHSHWTGWYWRPTKSKRTIPGMWYKYIATTRSLIHLMSVLFLSETLRYQKLWFIWRHLPNWTRAKSSGSAFIVQVCWGEFKTDGSRRGGLGSSEPSWQEVNVLQWGKDQRGKQV